MSENDFWSRRKARVRAEEEAEKRTEAARSAEEKAAELAEKPDEEILEELGLPEPETLREGDDFRAFLNSVVPARIRSRALRHLWRVNPALANLDGLLEYGEDFTDAATVVENLATTYQVGKGMARHVAELARQAKEGEEQDTETAIDEPGEADAEESALQSGGVAEANEEQAGLADTDRGAEAEERLANAEEAGIESEKVGSRPRRMRYSFLTTREKIPSD